MIASRALSLLILTNFLTFVITAVLPLPVVWSPATWGASLACSVMLFRIRFVRRPSAPAPGMPVYGLLAAALLLLAIPRLTYLLAQYPTPYNFAIPGWDDWAHIAELVAMTAPGHYPLHAPFNPDYFFSYYYASLYPAAVLKLLFPVLSLQSTIFISTLGYALGIGLSVIELSRAIFRRRAIVITFVAMFLFAGSFGFIPDVLLGSTALIDMHLIWQNHVFGHDARVTPFLAGLFWVPQHMIGFYALVLSWVVATRMRLRTPALKSAVVTLLLVAAFYTSPFTFLPAILVLGLKWKILLNRLRRHTLPILAALATAIPPLWIFLFKPTGIEFVWLFSTRRIFNLSPASKAFFAVFNFPIWYVMEGCIEFLGLPVVLVFLFPRLKRADRSLCFAALLFYASTYIVAFSNANNYSCRGMFLAWFIMQALVLKVLDDNDWRLPIWRWRTPSWILPAVFLCSLSGTLIESLWEMQLARLNWSPMFARNAVAFPSHETADRLVLLGWLKSQDLDPQAINRSSTPLYARDILSEVNRAAGRETTLQRTNTWFIEKFQKVPFDRMIGGEKELIRFNSAARAAH